MKFQSCPGLNFPFYCFWQGGSKGPIVSGRQVTESVISLVEAIQIEYLFKVLEVRSV